MGLAELTEDLEFELNDEGYTEKLSVKKNHLFYAPKSLFLNPEDLFFCGCRF